MSQPEPDGRLERLTSLKLTLELTDGLHWSNREGELDIASVSEVAEVVDGLAPDADGVQHMVLDLRGMTSIDAYAHRRSRDPPTTTRSFPCDRVSGWTGGLR
jgi:hypothetical protein